MDVRTPVRWIVAIYENLVVWGTTFTLFAGAWLVSPWLGRRTAFDRGLRLWGRTIHRLGGQVTRREGMDDLPAPAVWAVNHRHASDIMLLTAVATTPIAFVARHGVGRVPIIGSVLRAGGHLFIKRGAAASNAPTMARAQRLLEDGVSIVFFPEGTRSRDGRIGPYMPGAFRLAAKCRVPLIPIAVAGTEHVIPRGVLVQPARLAVRALAARHPTPEQANDAAYRESVRREVEAAVLDLRTVTGPRI